MDLDRIKEMGSDPEFISGIYNYCDRWCERCRLSSKCMLFRMEKEDELEHGKKSRDLNSEEFWDQLADTFELTFQLIEDIAQEEGIDLDDLSEEEIEDTYRWDQEEMEHHPVVSLSEEYFNLVMDWFDTNDVQIQSKIGEIEQKAKLGNEVRKMADKALKINDFIDIIQWYYTMIVVKSRRAVHGLLFPSDFGFEEESPIQNDMNGTAKLLDICAKRSMYAWKGLMDELPEFKDDCIEKLAVLQRLRSEIKRYFPDARKFIRPGFDEEVH